MRSSFKDVKKDWEHSLPETFDDDLQNLRIGLEQRRRRSAVLVSTAPCIK